LLFKAYHLATSSINRHGSVIPINAAHKVINFTINCTDYTSQSLAVYGVLQTGRMAWIMSGCLETTGDSL